MNFKLIQEPNPNWNAVTQILVNRGIEQKNIEHYLNTSEKDVNAYEFFGIDVLKDAATALISTISSDKECIVVVDSDCDGFTSAALLINYLYDLFPSWVENKLKWFIHEGKQHGLKDFPDVTELNDLKLVICPDSASNDYEMHKELKDDCVDVIILDHHEAEKISKDAIVINNQLSDYPNKELSGVGVTWQFCRYLDDLMEKSEANKYLDLVALGNMADMMSLKSYETKYLINEGFKQENIKNPFIYYMAQKNSFKLGSDITPMGAAFYIAPFVNAMVRSGKKEEKELLFNSMLSFKAFQIIPSTKRGHKLGETEKLVEQAIRTATNVKNRQTREENKGLELLEKLIDERNLLDHKVLLFLLEPGQIDKNIAGLIANKFMAKYQRPCCILTRVEEDIIYNTTEIINIEDERVELEKPYLKVKRISYQGSARGYDKSGIINFKDICENAPNVIFAEGHQGAFGLGINDGIYYCAEDYEMQSENILQFIDYMDEKLKDMSSEPIYNVDYIYDGINVTPENIYDIGNLENLWGKDVDEPYIAIKNLKITKDMVTIYAKDTNTLKITLPNKVNLIKFKVSDEECSKFQTDGYIEINIVGRCSVNEFNGWTNAQIKIEDYEIVDSAKYFF